MNDTRSVHDVDWPAFLAQHDMRFSELPDRWQAAPHLGNAMVGSMLYRVDNTLRLQVFRADVHDHRDESYGWTAYSRPRFMIGHFSLEPVGRLTGCDWRKDLWNAELTGTITTDRGEIGLRHFVHADDMAIVTELTPSEGEGDVKWTWHPAAAESTRTDYPRSRGELGAYARRYGERHRETIKLFTPNPDGRLETRGEVSVWVQDLLAGGQYATAWAESQQGETRTHLASIASSYPQASAASTAVEDVERCLARDDQSWVDAHRKWWHAYFRRSFVAIPDDRLEALYWQTIYRFGCMSRAGRHYVDTSGLWFQGGPWAYTTHDWNTQSAHWAVYAANRLEQGEEVVDRLHAGLENLIDAVHPYEWREDSAYLALATAGDMAGSRVGDMRYYNCVGCLPWLLHNAWWQHRFAMDDDLLREKVYPLLRRAMNLYLHLTEEGDDGKLHLRPTYSPETGAYRDANFDLALFKWGCHTLLRACDRLGIDDPLIPRWQDVVDRLVDFPADENGFMLGSDQTARFDHRHLSHLLMIYPLHLVNVDRAEVIEMANRSYDAVRGRSGSDDGAICKLAAMLQTHAAPIGAALGRGDDAMAGLVALADDLSPAGLWPNGDMPPCIESTLGLANIVQDMLIQSWSDPAADEPGPIRIFPALPSDWRDVTYHDLRAEGAFLVSAHRRKGRTTWVRVKSLAGEPCRVRFDAPADPQARGEREHELTQLDPHTYEIDLKQGESVELHL